MEYSPEDQQRIVDNINSRLSTFLVNYLGTPRRDTRILIKDLYPLVGWVKLKAEPWSGRFTSKRSKKIHIYSCLYSPHVVELYILSEGVRGNFAKEVSRFFCQMSIGYQKY